MAQSKSVLETIKNTSVSNLLRALIGVCLLSMAGVTALYHLALGRLSSTAAECSNAAQGGLRSSYALIESLSLTQNSLLTLLRERDPDVLEKLVTDLEHRQTSLAAQIDKMGRQGDSIRQRYAEWNVSCRQIVETFLRGENAEANSRLVNELMPRGQALLLEVRAVNENNEQIAAARMSAMTRDMSHIRWRSLGTVGIAALVVAATGWLLRLQVERGSGAFGEMLGRLTSLRQTNELLEKRVRERTAEIEAANAQREELNNRLLVASRQAGMAEVATGVLHNVGNVLNSVNVSATVVSDKLRQSEVASLGKVAAMIDANKNNLQSFLTNDDRGQLIPGFICELAQCLGEEQKSMLDELSAVARGIDHIKQIVTAQQSLARKGAVLSPVEPAQLMETALSMQGGALDRHDIKVERRFAPIGSIELDKHKILQILINLISNAKHALKASRARTKRITLKVEKAGADLFRFSVADNGAGIAAQNLAKIFSMGFTTRTEGHGFGLHSAANAAREMGGSLTAFSDGADKGAVFTLELPLVPHHKGTACKR